MSLSKFTYAALSAVVVVLAGNAVASAQLPNIFVRSPQGPSGFQQRDDDALYASNAQLPLGGFFAEGFTRTFTLLGGANFAAGDLPGGFSSLSSDQDSGDVGYAISGAMGRRHNRRLRSEIELAVRGNDQDFSSALFGDVDSNVNAYSLMKNVIFDFPNQSRFTPYLGAGLGISLVEVEAQTSNPDDVLLLDSPSSGSSEVSEEDTAFTYQFIGGIAAEVNRGMDFVIEYRFLGTSDVELDTLGSQSYLVNNLFLGLKLEY